MSIHQLEMKYPNLVFWTHLKNRPSYLGSTQGDICRLSDKKLLAKFMIPDGYVGVELCNEEVHCVSNLIFEMAMPDEMAPISRKIHIELPKEAINERMKNEPEEDIPFEPPTEIAKKFADEFPEFEPMLHNGLLNILLNQ